MTQVGSESRSFFSRIFNKSDKKTEKKESIYEAKSSKKEAKKDLSSTMKELDRAASDSKVEAKSEKPKSALDEKIEKLEKESTKSKKTFFGRIYNAFSKKDNKMEAELLELKEAKKQAEADGVITKQELALINKEYSEANDSFLSYKDGKKKAADTTATVGAIAAGVVITAATGGVAGVALAAGAAAVTKVGAKEAMLGSEYEALGKEGLKDGASQALWTVAGGGLGMALKGASVATKVGATVVKDQVCLAATSENYRDALKTGDFKTIAATAGTSAVFGKLGSSVGSAKSIAGKVAVDEALTFSKRISKEGLIQGSQLLTEKLAEN